VRSYVRFAHEFYHCDLEQGERQQVVCKCLCECSDANDFAVWWTSFIALHKKEEIEAQACPDARSIVDRSLIIPTGGIAEENHYEVTTSPEGHIVNSFSSCS
jgi:hypothetical protein